MLWLGSYDTGIVFLNRNELKKLNYLDNEDTFTIKNSRRSKHSGKYIYQIEASGKTFYKLVNKQIPLGWDKILFKEDFSIIHCYQCTAYGHKITECNNKITCKKCSQDHPYWNCVSKNVTCNNCLKSNNKYNTNYNYLHEANSTQCPIQKQIELKIKEKTDYS